MDVDWTFWVGGGVILAICGGITWWLSSRSGTERRNEESDAENLHNWMDGGGFGGGDP